MSVLSREGGLVNTTTGFSIDTRALGKTAFDTLLIAGSTDIPEVSAELIARLRTSAPRARRVGSVCTGAFIFAATGLLEGRQATTHWAMARELQQRFPEIQVTEDRIYTADGALWTSAGMTSCIDMALAMLTDDLGAQA
ncbi:AraC family transcriptional regulator, partial [Leptospira sp. SA-E8]|uniref:AraC family transcriptional regulator n=1 Tax=Leptospira sp. SA-E8 TaxID=3422259 RepID=UPI003EBE6963